MEDLIERAIAAVKALPEAAQESIGKSMLDAAVVISELKRRYGA